VVLLVNLVMGGAIMGSQRDGRPQRGEGGALMEPLPGLTPEPDPAPTFLRRLGTTLLDYARLIAFFLGPLLIGLVLQP
jgi:hypothetical protein